MNAETVRATIESDNDQHATDAGGSNELMAKVNLARDFIERNGGSA